MLWRDPILLWLLPPVGVAGAVLVVALRRRGRQMAAFAEAALARRLTPDVDAGRRAAKAALRIAALALLVLSVAGPKWGFHWEQVHREGIDLIVAIDVSRSMLATDVKPNRLERAKLAVLDLVKLLQGDRIGLVAFAGTAFLECPLTLDYAAFEHSLRALEPGIIPRGGTALGPAIDVSVAGFEAREGKHEALILITDGEDHEGKAEEAARRAGERGIRVFTVGIGTSEGDLIPDAAGQFVKDRKGQVVKSRLDEEMLQKIAAESSGAYVRGIGAALGLDQVFRDHIAKMERREVASTLERRYEERFQIPLAAALVLLVLESLLGERKPAAARRRFRLALPRIARSGGTRRAAALLLAALMPLQLGWLDPPGDRAAEGNRLYEQGRYAEAAEKYGEGLVDAPESALLQFNRAAALYKDGKLADAVAALTRLASSGDPKWTAKAAYNLGNAQYRLAAQAESSDPSKAIAGYEQALAAYRRALGSDPQNEDAKFNYELVSKKLTELKKKLEEQEQQEQQQEQRPQEQQAQEQQPQDQPQEQQPEEPQDQGQQEPPSDQPQGESAPEPQEPQPEEQPGEQAQAGAQPREEAAEEPPPQEPGQGSAAAAAGEKEEENADAQAAQAVIDTARGEELDPQELRRPVGRVAGELAPAQDW